MLRTEQRNERTTHLDQMSALEIARAMNRENAASVEAVEAVLPQVALAIEAITAAFAGGGRLFYLGAGTSGRLAVVDAAECPPTFGAPPELIIDAKAETIIMIGIHTPTPVRARLPSPGIWPM